MRLFAKFNIALVVVFLLGVSATGFFTYETLHKNAREEVIAQADIMMGAAQAIRHYTVEEIKPLLSEQLKTEFLPQSVPAYAATQNFNALRNQDPYREFYYKEAALNPTNPINRAVDWESDIIQQFRSDAKLERFIGERETPSGPSLYLSRPIKIKDAGCLTCHNTFSEAPRPLLKKYGLDNGFGWKLDEVVAAQIVSVPMSVPIKKADRTFKAVMGALTGIFVIIMIVLNMLLRHIVVKPIVAMSKIADEVSKGNMSAPEFNAKSNDEVGILATSFNRMRRSLENALSLLEDENK